MRQFVYHVYIKFRFLSGKLDEYWSIAKFPKHYDQDCLRIFLFVYTLSWMIKVGIFLKEHFDLNQTCDIVIKQNYSIWNFKTIELPYIFNNYWRKYFWRYKIFQKVWAWRRLGQVFTKSLFAQSVWKISFCSLHCQ